MQCMNSEYTWEFWLRNLLFWTVQPICFVLSTEGKPYESDNRWCFHRQHSVSHICSKVYLLGEESLPVRGYSFTACWHGMHTSVTSFRISYRYFKLLTLIDIPNIYHLIFQGLTVDPKKTISVQWFITTYCSVADSCNLKSEFSLNYWYNINIVLEC